MEIVLCPLSLLIYIWGLVEHTQLQKKDLQQTQFQFKQSAEKMWFKMDELNISLKTAHQIFQVIKDNRKIFVFKWNFHNEGLEYQTKLTVRWWWQVQVLKIKTYQFHKELTVCSADVEWAIKQNCFSLKKPIMCEQLARSQFLEKQPFQEKQPIPWKATNS